MVVATLAALLIPLKKMITLSLKPGPSSSSFLMPRLEFIKVGTVHLPTSTYHAWHYAFIKTLTNTRVVLEILKMGLMSKSGKHHKPKH